MKKDPAKILKINRKLKTVTYIHEYVCAMYIRYVTVSI